MVQEDIRNLQKHGIDTAAQAVVRSESNGAAAAPSSGTNLTYGNSFDDSYFAALPNGHGAHCYVGRGLYLLQLQQWLKAGYRRDQLLVVCTERLQANPHCELKRVFEFLGLPPCDTIDTTPVNTASQRGRNFGPMAEVCAQRLQARAVHVPAARATVRIFFGCQIVLISPSLSQLLCVCTRPLANNCGRFTPHTTKPCTSLLGRTMGGNSETVIEHDDTLKLQGFSGHLRHLNPTFTIMRPSGRR